MLFLWFRELPVSLALQSAFCIWVPVMKQSTMVVVLEVVAGLFFFLGHGYGVYGGDVDGGDAREW
jgi:hypothetical protein